MALEGSASEQERGDVHPGYFSTTSTFILLRIGASFQKQPAQPHEPSPNPLASLQHPHTGVGAWRGDMEAHSPTCLHPFSTPPPLPPQSPTLAVNSPRDYIFFFFLPGKRQTEKTPGRFGNGLSNRKMNGERKSHFSFFPPLPRLPSSVGQAKASNF